MPAFLIDPKTGERVGSSPSAVQIDPATGERVQAAPQLPPVPGIAAPQGLTGPPSTNYAGMALKAGTVAKDVGIGALKGAGSTANNLGHIFYPDFVAKHFTGAPSPQQQDNYFAPSNTSQAVGKGIEQVGEFIAPGGAEEAGAAKLTSVLPGLGKAAAPIARLATGALSTGLVNKAQGGSFAGGAAAGAAGGALSEGLRAAAPIVAESALGIRGVDRRAPLTPGRAILDETTGVDARGIADQATAKQSLYTTQRDALLDKAPPIDLTPARLVVNDAAGVAATRNNPETIKRVGQIGDLLNYEGGKAPAPTLAPPKVIPGFGTAAANPPRPPSNLIPPTVPATRANALKQGLGELKGSWNPAVPNSFAEGTIGRTYGTLDKSLDAAAPGTSGLNDKISGLFPVAQRANATDLNASTLQRVLGRFTRPTGALVGGLGGAAYGAHEGGLPGALTYGAAGLVAPEVIGSPTVQMGMARGFSKGATPVVRTLLGGGLQATTRKSLYSGR